MKHQIRDGFILLIKNKRFSFYLLLSLMSVAGISAALFVTRHGVGILPYDSIEYISVARNFLAGHGLYAFSFFADTPFRPMTHFPPLFPLLIAAISWFRIDAISAARYCNAFLFGANIFCVGIAALLASKSRKAGIIAGFFALAYYRMLSVHSIALSEPLFLFLEITGFISFSFFLNTHKESAIWIASILFSLAFLTRYLGFTLVISAMVAVVCFDERDIRAKLRDSIGIGIIGMTPMSFWLIRNYMLATNPFDRTISFCPIKSYNLLLGISTVGKWIFPGSTLPLIAIPVFALLFVGFVWTVEILSRDFVGNFNSSSAKFRMEYVRKPFTKSLALFCGIYCVFLILSVLFVDHETPFDFRILMPIFLPMLILTLTSGRFVAMMVSHIRYAQSFLVCGLLVIAISHVLCCSRWMTKPNYEGKKCWQFLEDCALSPSLEMIQGVSKGVSIYSNYSSLFHLFPGRHVAQIPWINATEYRYMQEQHLKVQLLQRVKISRSIMIHKLQLRNAEIFWLAPNHLHDVVSTGGLSESDVVRTFHLRRIRHFPGGDILEYRF